MKGAALATSYSRTYLYQLINEGRLRTYRRGGRVFVTVENHKKLIDEDSRNGRTKGAVYSILPMQTNKTLIMYILKQLLS